MATKLKLKIGSDAAKVEATAGFSQYVGEVPPPGVYKASVKNLQIKESKSGKTMLVAIIEFAAPKGSDAAKFNGYAIFDRLVIPESMSEEYADLAVGRINRLLDAISGDQKLRTAFWGGHAVLDDKGEKVLKIGKLVTGGKGFKGFPVVVSARNDSYTRKTKGSDGKVNAETVRSLRVNDIYPASHGLPGNEPEPEEVDSDEEYIEEDESADVDTDIDTDEDESYEEEASEDEPETEDEPDVDVDDDEDLAEGEMTEVDDDEEPEEEPAPTKRRGRRSAF